MSVRNLAYGVMNDTGSFVLVGSDCRNIWESFDSFADTMLPTQVIGRGGVINSKLSETNFTLVDDFNYVCFKMGILFLILEI